MDRSSRVAQNLKKFYTTAFFKPGDEITSEDFLNNLKEAKKLKDRVKPVDLAGRIIRTLAMMDFLVHKMEISDTDLKVLFARCFRQTCKAYIIYTSHEKCHEIGYEHVAMAIGNLIQKGVVKHA